MFSILPRRTASSCVACQKRFSHKLVEIELTQNIVGLGRIGDRCPVSPGRARNVLIPNQQAMYVVAGKAVSPLRDMMAREQLIYGSFIPTTRPLLSSAVHADPSTAEDPTIALKETESALLDALSLLPILSFSRRLISSSTAPLLPSSSKADKVKIFGSVAESDVLEQMKEFGVTLEEGMGAFADTQEGIDKGRVKAIGKYLFTVNLKALEETVDVIVQVSAGAEQ